MLSSFSCVYWVFKDVLLGEIYLKLLCNFFKTIGLFVVFFVIGLLYTLGKFFFLVCIYQHISEISDTFSENSDMHVYLNMFLYQIYLSV